MTRFFAALVLVAASFSLPVANASDCARRESLLGTVVKTETCNKSLTWRFDRAEKAFVRDARIVGSGPEGVRFDFLITGRCEAYVDCQAAHTCQSGGRRYNVRAWRLLPDGSRLEPGVDDTVCVYPETVVPLASVSAAAHEEIRKRISAPTLTSAPPGKTLVNIITVYSTDRQPEPRIDITTPVPGSIVAVPEYRWDFGDGQTALGPGLQWSAPDDPNKLPGKYLGPVWRTSGIKHVTLTVTWRVRFQLQGVIDVPLEPIVLTATEDKQVMTARAVLVNQ